MKLTHTAKILGASILTLGFMSGTAIAGDKKACKDKQHTSIEKSEMATPTMVLPAKAETKGYPVKSNSKIISFDEALELCLAKQAANLQACIDAKTGQVTQPKS